MTLVLVAGAVYNDVKLKPGPTEADITAAKRINGIVYESGRQSFYSKMRIKIVTEAEQEVAQILFQRTGKHNVDYIQPAKDRDRALHYLSKGTALHKYYSLDYRHEVEPWSGLEKLDPIRDNIKDMKEAVISYDPASDISLQA